MQPIGLLIKSYARDFDYLRRLESSIREFNREDLPVFLIVPAADVQLFESVDLPSVQLMAEEDVVGQYLVSESAHGLSAGYLNQEIVKLSFGETGLLANYFCVDSEAVFVRPFGALDFLRQGDEPYSVLVQDKELEVEPRYYREHWVGREEAIRQIMEFVGLDDPIMKTCHGHQIFSSRVLQSFSEDFLAPRGWTYTDAVMEIPYEFSWYNMWLQKSRVIPIHQIEPLVKVFHNEDQHLEYVLRGINMSDIARAYLAVVVNSNYSRDLGIVGAAGNKIGLASSYLSYAEVWDVVRAKASETWSRRLGRQG